VGRLREFYRQRDVDEALPAVSLPGLVEQVIALTQPKWKNEAQRDGRTIVVEADLQPVPLVAANETELREALTNLIFNAVDAMPTGGTITVRTAPSGDDVLLEVIDTGIGMTEETRRRCLDPFFTSKGARGTGLGLPMVYGIVHRHGGRLDIDTAPGRGTTVRVTLPANTAQPAPDESRVAPSRSLHVLVVDDEPAVRRVAEDYLLAEGHAVESAGGGREALAKIATATSPYDLVVTDRAMPELGGDQLARAVKALDPSMPIVLMTGFGDLMNASGERPEGVDAVIGKPITRRILTEALAAVARPDRQPSSPALTAR
jgi:CheY-like chemotaxis protein/anti-sigma regulatory factor (Ser/Thr protein kinase)